MGQRVNAYVILLDIVQVPSLGIVPLWMPTSDIRSTYLPMDLPAEFGVKLLKQ